VSYDSGAELAGTSTSKGKIIVFFRASVIWRNQVCSELEADAVNPISPLYRSALAVCL
jgi:hypothetical protein